jgi:hypothetical protein
MCAHELKVMHRSGREKKKMRRTVDTRKKKQNTKRQRFGKRIENDE